MEGDLPPPLDRCCVRCGRRQVRKIIFLGLPGRFCFACHTMTGLSAWAPPIATETEQGPMFAFLPYEGSYLAALWRWLTGRAS